MEFATLETRRRLEPKCVPQLILGSLLGTRQAAIGHFFSPVPGYSSRSLCEIFILVSVVANVCFNVSNEELSVSKASNKKAVDIFLFLVFLYFLFLSFVFVYVVLFA